MRHKIGLYCRVSTDEQALRSEGSLETQKHRLQSFVDIKNMSNAKWGSVIEHYVDDGYSAKDLRRPAFQRLMGDLRRGRINMILVTDVSPLSRNMLDFCNLLEELKKYKAKYLSIKENFDTSTSVGELMIKTMMTLNEFERNQTAERVATNFHVRALRGLRNGGRVPFGYDRNPNDLARLVINESEAAEVREVFRVYLEEGTCGSTVSRLNDMGLPHRTKTHGESVSVKSSPWTRNSLLLVLRRSAYAGIREINKKNKKSDQEPLKPSERYEVVQASWPAIVDMPTWEATQRSLDFSLANERVRLKNKTSRCYLLTGLLKCADCGGPLMGAAGHGRTSVHRYYIHSRTTSKRTNCKMNFSLPAEKLEGAVEQYLDSVLERQGFLDRIESDVRKSTMTRHRDLKVAYSNAAQKLETIEISIKKTIAVQAKCNDETLDEAFKDSLRGLADEKRQIQTMISELESLKQESREPQAVRQTIEHNIKEFRKAWKKASPALKKRLLGGIFESVVVDSNGLSLHYYLGDEFSSPDPQNKKPKSEGLGLRDLGQNQNVRHFINPKQKLNKSGLPVTTHWDQKVVGSDIDEVGRGDLKAVSR